MIRSSAFAKFIAFGLSTVVLVGGMRLAAPKMVVEMAGGGKMLEARMGASFEDMSVGTLIAEPVEDTPIKPTPPEETSPAQQLEKTLPTPAETTAQFVPTEVPLASTVANPVQAPQPILIPQLIEPEPSITLLTALPALDAVAPQITSSPTVTATLTPALLQPIERPTETIASKTPDTTAPPLSMRPKRRDLEKAAKAAAARPKPKNRKVAKADPRKPKAQRGNAKRNNTQGAANGTNQKSKGKSQGRSKPASAQSGNAAASNYPGQVMRRISRVPKPRVNARGTTVVSFSVSSSGGIAGAFVARSSGFAALDQAALRVIRKASPFPKPPRGARRDFSIRIKGR